MNLDKLISKYLDGELNRSEDNELRRLLSDDFVAKETFDAHVLIHAAMKEDAKTITPSAELVSNTEDLILNKFLSEQSFSMPASTSRMHSRTFAYASLVALLLIFSFISISDLNIYSSNENIDSALNHERTKILQSSAFS